MAEEVRQLLDQIERLKQENATLEKQVAAEGGAPSKVPNTEAVIKRWDSFAALYAKTLGVWSMASCQTLMSNLQLDSATGLLEVACGPGHVTSRIKGMMPATARYVATDYSEEFVKMTTAQQVDGVEVVQMDAQTLPDEYIGAFDRYMANLCLMIVPDAQAQLKSCYSALKPGGIAAFSIWGEKIKSKQFTLMAEVMKAEGIKSPSKPPPRSTFHLGQDDARLKAMFREAGFERLLLWHQMSR